MCVFDLKSRRLRSSALALLAACWIGGCSVVGPQAIEQGRNVYNEVINKTGSQQTLLLIVRARYAEPSSLLAVSSVTANVRMRTRAGVELGVGSKETYVGNLVPLGGDIVYEENPTIAYMPVRGEQYLKQMMSPIPLDLFVALVRSPMHSRSILWALISRVNSMRNPHFLLTEGQASDPRFARLVEIVSLLQVSGSLAWVQDSEDDTRFSIVIHDYSPTHSQQVNELSDLLDWPAPADDNRDIVIPVTMGIQARNALGMAITTRSAFDLGELLSASVDIPPEHLDAGLTVTYPPRAAVWENVRIRSSKTKPDTASVAAKYRDYWFYVDEADLQTKKFFYTLFSLWSVVVTSGEETKAAPVLTVPVSR
jgi:hypothetical protein